MTSTALTFVPLPVRAIVAPAADAEVLARRRDPLDHRLDLAAVGWAKRVVALDLSLRSTASQTLGSCSGSATDPQCAVAVSLCSEFTSAFGGIADMAGLATGPTLVANDPQRTCPPHGGCLPFDLKKSRIRSPNALSQH
jgi:hypothetical protein